MPKSRVGFWNRKFSQNVQRDRLVRREIRRLGWKAIVIWECKTPDTASLVRRLRTMLVRQ
jgi:DNA mismatch endonuclease (patch repair protein)